MYLRRLLLSLTIAVVINLTLNLLWGEWGLTDYRAARQSLENLQANLEELQQIRNVLIVTIDELQNNSQYIRLEARALGIIAPEEYMVRIGRQSIRWPAISPGRVVLTTLSKENNRRGVFRALSLCAGLIFLLLSLVTGSRNIRRKSGYRDRSS